MWEQQALQYRQLSSPEVFSSYLAVGDYAGYLHLVSQLDGQFAARIKLDSDGIGTRPLTVGDMLYVLGNSGKLIALRIP
jgi:outer membrane protein assembly factor BamB